MELKETFKSEYKGVPFHIVGSEAGHRCGYVGVPSGHKWYGLDYNHIHEETDWELNVHGGLTYSDTNSPLETKDNYWWIGFDCAHLGDAKDPDLLDGRYKQLMEENKFLFEEDGIIWTHDMVVNECKDLIDQMVDAIFE